MAGTSGMHAGRRRRSPTPADIRTRNTHTHTRTNRNAAIGAIVRHPGMMYYTTICWRISLSALRRCHSSSGAGSGQACCPISSGCPKHQTRPTYTLAFGHSDAYARACSPTNQQSVHEMYTMLWNIHVAYYTHNIIYCTVHCVVNNTRMSERPPSPTPPKCTKCIALHLVAYAHSR